MTILAHLLSASYIGIALAKVAPNETGLIIISLISAEAVDIDHLYFLIKNHNYFKKKGYKNNLHKARSIFHELSGFTLISLIAFLLSFINIKIALTISVPAMIHLTEDIAMGISIPFKPIDKTEIKLIPQEIIFKIIIDMLIIIIFGFLWIKYLHVFN